MNFDLVISNPPYNRGLDLKILKEVYPLGNRFVMVHPAGWLYNNKGKNKIEVRDTIKNHFVGYEKVKDANKLFGIGVFSDVLITEINKNKEGIGDKIYDIDIHGESKVYQSLKKKILNYCKFKNNLLNEVSLRKEYEYICSFSKLRGHPGTSDFYTFIQLQNESMHTDRNNVYHCNYNFNTSIKAINFKDYLKLKITRFCLSIYKNDANIISYNPSMKRIKSGAIASVPYMPTYKRQWTDEEVAKELGLTDEELRWAINWIPDYYPEDAEKYKDYE